MFTAYTKKVRLKDGRFVTVKRMASDPVSVSKAAPNQTWECSDGRVLLVSEMETRHIVNTIATLLRRADDLNKRLQSKATTAQVAASMWPVFLTLQAEMDKRLGVPKTAKKPENNRFIELD